MNITTNVARIVFIGPDYGRERIVSWIDYEAGARQFAMALAKTKVVVHGDAVDGWRWDVGFAAPGDV